MKKELEIITEIETTSHISVKRIVVKLKTFENKLDILKNKYKLAGQNIYIDSDLTKSEQFIQAEIRKKAREERQHGRKIKVSYQKMMIDGVWYKWDHINKKIN